MATTNAKTPVFLDTNVLIRLHVETAPSHENVREAIKRLVLDGKELWISRQVLREYAAALTRHQPYTTLPLTPASVAHQLRAFALVYRIADETAEVTNQLCTLLETTALGGKQVHDANIAATMLTYGITLLFTFNTVDFTRFSSLITLLTLEEILMEKP